MPRPVQLVFDFSPREVLSADLIREHIDRTTAAIRRHVHAMSDVFYMQRDPLLNDLVREVTSNPDGSISVFLRAPAQHVTVRLNA